MVHPVPRARRRLGLLLVDPLGEVDVEAEEVDQLAGAVDLGLVRGLALAQHGGGVHALRGSVVASRSAARRKTAARSSKRQWAQSRCASTADGDGGIDGGAVRVVQLASTPGMAVRRDDVVGVSAPDLAAADDGGDVGPLRAHAVSALLSAPRSALPGA